MKSKFRWLTNCQLAECTAMRSVLRLLADPYKTREGTMLLSTKLTIAMSLVAGFLYFSVRSAAADQIGFAVDVNKNLFSVDLTTAKATLIGNTGQFLEGLAVSPQGGLFGTDFVGDL